MGNTLCFCSIALGELHDPIVVFYIKTTNPSPFTGGLLEQRTPLSDAIDLGRSKEDCITITIETIPPLFGRDVRKSLIFSTKNGRNLR